ncbi:MAG TPA: hypothetical protein VMV93_02395 [Chloroflexota bacterium]|nr:hypothetical protein [Chloroflexota bacterium]
MKISEATRIEATETTGLETPEAPGEVNDPAGGPDSNVDQNGDFQGNY